MNRDKTHKPPALEATRSKVSGVNHKAHTNTMVGMTIKIINNKQYI